MSGQITQPNVIAGNRRQDIHSERTLATSTGISTLSKEQKRIHLPSRAKAMSQLVARSKEHHVSELRTDFDFDTFEAVS